MGLRARAAVWIALGALSLGVGAMVARQSPVLQAGLRSAEPPLSTPLVPTPVPPVLEEPPAEANPSCAPRPRAAPVGRPAMLSCREARQIVAQVRSRLALPRPRPDAALFAEGLRDWLDPHGLWTAAPDAPPAARIRELGARILDEIEQAPSDARACSSAHEVGRDVASWVDELRRVYVQSRDHSPALAARTAFRLASAAIFQDEPVRPARGLVAELGRRVGVFRKSFPDVDPSFSELAGERFVPELSVVEWEQAVLAAALRAYVPSVDPHGQWAPLDEEWSLYADDTDLGTGPRLWNQMARSAIGVKILDGALSPLGRGDLVLSIDGVPTAGLSVEQLEQLSWLDSQAEDGTRKVGLLHAGESELRVVRVEMPPVPPAESERLGAERLPYGSGYALVLTVPDVSDTLGDQLSAAIRDARRDVPLSGVVLDLRGNGGGSTDGAASAIGVFLPGVPSFPVLMRGGEIEVEHARVPGRGGSWTGPVAAIVDGYTASAAEMIAGALTAYRRGVVIGTRTFGKGCIQEYFDDRVGAGVLRLTTMLFALPDGSPLQGVGLMPSVYLPLAAVREREAILDAALPPWRGPDVRQPPLTPFSDWPRHAGHFGPCRDSTVCVALHRLGQAKRRPNPNRAAKIVGSARRLGAR